MHRHTRSLRALFAPLSITLWLLSAPAHASIDFAFYNELPLSMSMGIPLDQGTGIYHGIIYLQYTNKQLLGRGNQLRVGLNTETVWLAFDLGANANRSFAWSPYIKGQFGFGEMTPDYLAGGEFLEDFGFFTMIAEIGADARLRLWRSLHLVGNVGLRYWWFLPRTDPNVSGFTMPLNSPGARAELALSWDAMDTWVARGRLSHGFHARLSARIRHRFQQAPWGGLQTTRKDLRNASIPHLPTVQLHAQVAGAARLHERIGIAIDAMAGYGWFADDLHRFKLGGDNPYIPMLSGTYFAEFVVDGFVLAHASIIFLPLWWLRITPQVDLGLIQDPLRKGELDTLRPIVGIGLAFDFFFRDNMRLHLKFSYAPNAPRPNRDGGVKAMLGFVAYW